MITTSEVACSAAGGVLDVSMAYLEANLTEHVHSTWNELGKLGFLNGY